MTPATPESAQHLLGAGLMQHLGIQITAIGDDWIAATMPVDARTRQPAGLLHGGASAALAETIGSIGAYLCIDRDRYELVGTEINASHLRAVPSGYVTGTARPLRIGRRQHVWQIDITDEQGRLNCVSRLTMAILEKR